MPLEITGAIILALTALLIFSPLLYRICLAARDRVIARKLGYSFQRQAPPGFCRLLGAFELLAGPESSEIYNLMFRDEGGRKSAVFYINYDRDLGVVARGIRTERVKKVRYFFAQSPAFDLPHFRLIPKDISHRLQGLPDINFPENPAFSRRYLLQGSPEGEVRAVFTPDLLDLLAPRRPIWIEGWQDRLLLVHQGVSTTRLLRSGLEIRSILEEPAKPGGPG